MRWPQSGICYNQAIDTLLFGCLSKNIGLERGDGDFFLFNLTFGLEDIKHLAVANRADSIFPFFLFNNLIELDTLHHIYFHRRPYRKPSPH